MHTNNISEDELISIIKNSNVFEIADNFLVKEELVNAVCVYRIKGTTYYLQRRLNLFNLALESNWLFYDKVEKRLKKAELIDFLENLPIEAQSFFIFNLDLFKK